MRRLTATGSLVLAAGLVAIPATGQPQDRPSPSSAVAGSRTYRVYCAVCHGQKGKGDGPLAEGLRSTPPDLTLIARDNGGEYPAELVAKIIDGREPVVGHGAPDMPVWGDAFQKSEPEADDERIKQKIQSLVVFIEQLQEK